MLRGNLAPGGAIIKQSAADPKLMEHEGRAVVFENVEDLAARIDSDDLDVDGRRRAGAEEHRPEGRAGHARGRLHPDPAQAGARRRQGHGAHLRRPHERHGVRHHRAARDAGSGDRRAARARAQRRPHPPAASPSARSRCWCPTRNWRAARATRRCAEPTAERGYRKLFLQTVTQADQGVDFDFLRAPKMVGKVPRYGEMTMTTRLRGVLAPVLTPFDRRARRPIAGRFVAHCRWLVDNDAGAGHLRHQLRSGVDLGRRAPRADRCAARGRHSGGADDARHRRLLR